MEAATLIPARGFFPKYLSWVTRLTDAPYIYHIGSALAVASAAVANVVSGRVDMKGASGEPLSSVFPVHMWSLLVGPSGDRKSTATDTAVSCGHGAYSKLSSISGSPEATFGLVSEEPDIFFYHPEGSTLFAQLQASYWLQGQGLLCDLYDGRDDPPYTRTLVSRKSTKKSPGKDQTTEIVIRRPRLTMLIGIAPDLLDSTRRSDWTGGLIGRMFLLYGELKKPDERPLRQDEVGRKELNLNLVAMRNAAREASLVVTVRPDAMELYLTWCRGINGRSMNAPPRIRPMLRRLPIHVLRIAVLYAVSQFHDAVSMESMVPALHLGDVSRMSINRVGDLLAEDVVLRNSIRIRDMLQCTNDGMLSVQSISDELRLSWSAIEPALRTLEMTGRVLVRVDKGNSGLRWVSLVEH